MSPAIFRQILASCLLITAVALPQAWAAAPGDLDTSFGGGQGWVSTGFQQSLKEGEAKRAIQQADGKLVAAGSSKNGSNYDFALVRYNSDGALDTTFNGTGNVTTAIGSRSDVAYSVIQQADGKLVAAGYSESSSIKSDFALVRYNSDGALDTTFNGTGIVTTAIGSGYDVAYSVIQQADGKLVAAGSSGNGSNYDFALVRYNADGTLDTTFNDTGKVTIAIGGIPNSVIQQMDGKLVVAGYTGHSTTDTNNNDFALVRYNANGTLDTTFNGTGKVTTAIGSSGDRAYSVIQQADGKLVAAGYSNNPTPGPPPFRLPIGNLEVAVVRYNINGSLDTTFNGTGKVTTAMGSGTDQARSLIQQADGKLVVAGYISVNSYDDDFALVRYNTNGTLDASFGTGGKVTTGINASYDRAYSVIQQADGKLLAAGYTGIDNYEDFALVRYNADGTLDTTFNNTGKVTSAAIYTSSDSAYSVIQQADGKLVTAGYSGSGNYGDFALVRYNEDGARDTSFGTGGKVTTAIGSKSDTAFSVIQQMDGKLVAAGYTGYFAVGGKEDFALVRYNADGSLDTTFNGNGKVTTAIGSGQDEASSVIQQMDGKLVAVGHSNRSNNGDFALVRYNADGKLDTTFNGTGIVTTAIGSGYNVAESVIQQADGKLVAAGSSSGSSVEDFALVRYNVDGSLDTTFNGTGKVTTAIGSSRDQAHSVIQQVDGKLVAAGFSVIGSNEDFALVRYNTNGTLDTTFNGTGIVTTAIGSSYDFGYSVIQQADGKLVAAGRSKNGSGYSMALVRYNTNGTLDSTFNGTGKVTMAIVSSGKSVTQQADGRLVVAGAAGMSTGTEFMVARYESGQSDTDSDGYVDGLDTDDDNDGVEDASDAFPLDASESVDTDGDAIGNNADNDDDNDSVDDASDAFPLDATESADNDGDGIGNNVDTTPNGSADYSWVPAPASGLPPPPWIKSGLVTGIGGLSRSGLVSSGTLAITISNSAPYTVTWDTFGPANPKVQFELDGNVVSTSGVFSVPAGLHVLKWYVFGYVSHPTINGQTLNGVHFYGLDDIDSDGIPNEFDPDHIDYDHDGILVAEDNCPNASNANQLDSDGDGQGDACDSDDDNDGISDTGETRLGNNPLNNLDPPIAAISSQYILGIDNRTAGSSAFTTLWDNVEGGSPSSDSCDNCIVPGTDITTSASADVCGVNANGIKCLWWVMDTGDVNNEDLLPLQIAGETVTPLHDWDGYLKYVDSSSVLRHAVTDAFKISSDHFSHTCIVSKTAGVYCWASHSGTDIVSSNVPAALQNVSTVKDIAVGANHACAINNAAVECWGESASGKTTVPVIVNAPKQIAAGSNHTCAINANGSVSCWGDNSTNQLSDSNTDGLVDGVSNALKISAGKNHTCAVTGNYSTPSGLRVTCWGDNSAGQTTVPVALTNGVEKPVNITAAENQTCAIRAGQNVAANAMICWPVSVSVSP